MSFILDALRKSEHERQRQTGPALVETAVAPVKPGTNRWATAAVALLVVNLVALGVVLLMKSRNPPAAGATAASPAATTVPATATLPPDASATQAGPAGTSAVPGSGVPPAAAAPAPPAAQASVTRSAPATPPMMRPAAPPAVAGRNPLAAEVGEPVPAMERESAVAAAAPPAGPPAVQRIAPTGRGSVVYQSLPEADPVTSAAAAAAIAAEAANPARNLPRADDFAASGGGPELRLELHVYSTKPSERFVFVNSRRYREGDTTAEGVLVEQITPDGVIMSRSGNRFLLPRP